MARRALSLMLLLCFGYFSAEVAIADVCDGDGRVGAASVAPSDADDLPPADHNTRGTHNVPHVCHCAHAHGTLSADVTQRAGGRPGSALAAELAFVTPPVVDLEVHLRPPIAHRQVG